LRFTARAQVAPAKPPPTTTTRGAPIAFELLDDELGEAGERALSHLGARDAHDDRVVGADHHPGVDLGSHGSLRGGVAGERDMEAEREPGGRGGRAGEELAAGDL